MTDFYGQAHILKMLRAMLIHQVLPNDVIENDILILANMSKTDSTVWQPTSAIFVGPNQGTGAYDPYRIIVFYRHDRKITDIGIG